MPRFVRLLRCFVGPVAFALLVSVATRAATAATITSVTGTATATMTAAGGGPEADDYYASAGFSEDCGAGCTDFIASLQAGAGVEADAGENLRIDLEWSWTVDIVVTATSSTEAWELCVDTELLGYLTAVDQGGGSARARLTAVNGSLDAGGTGFTGSMDLAGTDRFNTGSDLNQLVSRMDTFNVVGGFGTQTVSMTFTLDGRLRSQCTGGACAGQGDEAAIRLGIPSAGTPPGFSAGDYPHPGDGDLPGDHGLFLTAVLVPVIPVPEPEAGGLIASALAALVGARCRRQPRPLR